jgi:hypothetical protein
MRSRFARLPASLQVFAEASAEDAISGRDRVFMTAAWNALVGAARSATWFRSTEFHRHRATLKFDGNFDIAQSRKGRQMVAVHMMIRKAILAFACGMAALAASPAQAQQATEIQLTYSKGQFQPAEVRAPADKPITFRVKNLDAKAMEFESKSLRVEKVVAANSEGVVNVRAMKPGRYEFFDDFNEKARGALTVQ